MSNYTKALEKSIQKKILELIEMQKNNVKYQHQQGLKEEIYRLKRTLVKLNQENPKLKK